METMKPCPRCGGKVRFWLDLDWKTYIVNCEECRHKVKVQAASAEEVIALWNAGGEREKDN